ncbi:MAG: SsrA-binding protein SmpB [Candidatus Lernaella stagnicola]|nr:SsrA-binding protein SmpB [Candidatus Lernaella stagnicola]
MGQGEKLIASNRKARFNYELMDRFEAGVALQGTEVKSLREGRCNLTDGFVEIIDGEAWLVDVHISPYSHGNRANHEPTRRRKLLLHRREIAKLHSKIAERGLTCIPLRMYFKDGKAKVEIALGRGKRKYDKREDIKRREADRETHRAMKR